MAVRIVENYWENYYNYEKLIKKCFFHICLKYTLHESLEEIFNTLLVEFYRMSIFQKFDASKHDPEKQNKKFEQFIYVWTNKVVRDTYNKARKNYYRNLTAYNVDSLTPSSYQKIKANNSISQWKSTQEIIDEGISVKKGKKLQEDKAPRWIPPCAALHCNRYVASYEKQDEELCAIEIRKKLEESFTGDDRVMLDMIIDGIDKKTILESVNCKDSKYLSFIKRLRKKTLLFYKFG